EYEGADHLTRSHLRSVAVFLYRHERVANTLELQPALLDRDRPEALVPVFRPQPGFADPCPDGSVPREGGQFVRIETEACQGRAAVLVSHVAREEELALSLRLEPIVRP